MLLPRLSLIALMFGYAACSMANSAEPCLKALENDELTEAVSLAEQALSKEQQQRDVLLCKGRAELNQGNAEAALQSFQSAESLASSAHEGLVAHIFIGHANKALGNIAPSQLSYEQALKLAQQEKNQKFQVIVHLLLGELLLQQADFPSAQQHYEHALQLAANNNERADAKEHLAQLKAKLGLFDEAIAHQVQALVMQSSDGNFDDYANAGLELGYLYINAKDFVNAEKNLNKIIDKAQEAGDGYWTAKGHYYLGLNFIAAKQLGKAKEALEQALEISEAIGAEKLAAEVNLQLQNLSQR